MAFFALEPWGAEWQNLLAGVPAAAIYEVNRDQKKNSTPYIARDFLFELDEAEEEPKTPDEIWKIVKTWAILSGAVKKHGNDQKAAGSTGAG